MHQDCGAHLRCTPRHQAAATRKRDVTEACVGRGWMGFNRTHVFIASCSVVLSPRPRLTFEHRTLSAALVANHRNLRQIKVLVQPVLAQLINEGDVVAYLLCVVGRLCRLVQAVARPGGCGGLCGMKAAAGLHGARLVPGIVILSMLLAGKCWAWRHCWGRRVC